MKIKLIKLYSEPRIFEPIIFENGINLIMGEEVQDTQIKNAKKTNGVGKSLCVEFINFCLLKGAEHSRLLKIPKDKLDGSTQIILDLEINKQPLTIIRTRGNPESPTIISNGNKVEYENLSDATEFLGKLLFSEMPENPNISFREFLGPFLRDEGSEFKDILVCYESNGKMAVPPAVKANAFMFGIDIGVINKIQHEFKELKKISAHKGKLKKSLIDKSGKKLKDIKTTLNSLNDDLKKIDGALNSFETNEAFESQQEDISQIQVEIDDLRSRQSAIRYEIKKIRSFPSLEIIKEKDIEIIYNQFKSGLGDIVTQSLKEVLGFKEKIDTFQKKLFNEKISSLDEELIAIGTRLRTLEENKLNKLTIIDKKGVLKDVKSGYAIYHDKQRLYSNIQSEYSSYEDAERQINNAKLEKAKYFQQLDTLIVNTKEIIESFNVTILAIHEFIMDSNEASFDIKTVSSGKSQQILSFEMRIDDDGSHSVNRSKVFIYDMALLFNEFTKKRHPHFLIHDNIFDVDRDSLIKSLNFINKQETQDFQYILTLNRDKIEDEESQKTLNLNILEHRIANFTKQIRFLDGEKYSEL